MTEQEISMKLDDTNSIVYKGLRIANGPDETGAYVAEILPESIPPRPNSKEEIEVAFQKAFDNAKKSIESVGFPKQKNQSPNIM